MAWYNPSTWNKKAGTEVAQQAVTTEMRSIGGSLSQPVFINQDGPNSIEWSHEQGRVHNLLRGFYAPQNFINLFYCVPEVFAPVNEIARRVADTCFQLKKDWNDEIDYNNATFNRIFEQPNPVMSFKDFVYQSVCYEICTGRMFQYANIPDTLGEVDFDNLLAMWNLPAHAVDVKMKYGFDVYSATDLSDLVQEYQAPAPSTFGSGIRKFSPDKVVQMINTSLHEPYDFNRAAPYLQGAEKPIANLIPVYEARGNIYIKRGALGFIVSRKSDASGQIALTKNEKSELLNDFQNSYGVTNGKSPVSITNQPVDFVRTAMSIQELQPFDETLADACAIYAALRIPRHLVPSKDSSTFANADTDMKSFYSNVINPWANRYAQAWTNKFRLADKRRYIFADNSKVPEMQENKKDRAQTDSTEGQTYLVRFQNGICTLNEWRIATGNKKNANPIYDKLIFDMTPDELESVKNVINLKTPTNAATSEDSGAQTQGSTSEQASAGNK